MIDYATFCRIHALQKEEGLNAKQIARELDLNPDTVSHWLKQEEFHPRKRAKRASKLDPFKGTIVRLLERHPYTAAQLLQKIRELGYQGGYSILKDYVRQVRPPQKPAYLTLHFEPGECAQVDWGSFGSIDVGNTRRRLSFFVMVLGYSRMMYVEFTLKQTLEHFLDAHQKAFEFFGGCPKRVMVDNLKSAVLSHPTGQPVVYHPRYLDFSRHYGFEIRACNVGAPQEKGRVENGVRYTKINFLKGLDLPDFSALNPAARVWLDTVANVRVHGETHQKPIDLFKEEKPALAPLPIAPYDVGVEHPVTASSRFRITLDTNRYSVPAEYASRRLRMRVYPERVLVYHDHTLIAEHSRRYDRHLDILNKDHERQLLQQRRRANAQRLLMRFLTLSPRAEDYYRELETRRMNPRHHVRQILALREIYGDEKVGRALLDAFEFQAFSCEYIANILEQRERQHPEKGALHLTRREDLLDLELPPPDLSIYDPEPFPPNEEPTDENTSEEPDE